ncbi:hypothetical protein EYF80_001172 [Liparis tanakae]|uniref:Uncharacterized protein n=1 Tax=Liparis tanakae TaxID=230148 RepID=A0A4Z2JDY3_9TELE|nr:hypothetical protein EYF80_001172 [Liparis tanakae]
MHHVIGADGELTWFHSGHIEAQTRDPRRYTLVWTRPDSSHWSGLPTKSYKLFLYPKGLQVLTMFFELSGDEDKTCYGHQQTTPPPVNSPGREESLNAPASKAALRRASSRGVDGQRLKDSRAAEDATSGRRQGHSAKIILTSTPHRKHNTTRVITLDRRRRIMNRVVCSERSRKICHSRMGFRDGVTQKSVSLPQVMLHKNTRAKPCVIIITPLLLTQPTACRGPPGVRFGLGSKGNRRRLAYGKKRREEERDAISYEATGTKPLFRIALIQVPQDASR